MSPIVWGTLLTDLTRSAMHKVTKGEKGKRRGSPKASAVRDHTDNDDDDDDALCLRARRLSSTSGPAAPNPAPATRLGAACSHKQRAGAPVTTSRLPLRAKKKLVLSCASTRNHQKSCGRMLITLVLRETGQRTSPCRPRKRLVGKLRPSVVFATPRCAPERRPGFLKSQST